MSIKDKYIYSKVPHGRGMRILQNAYLGMRGSGISFGEHPGNDKGTTSIILVKILGIFRSLRFHCFKSIIIIDSIMYTKTWN